MTEECSGTPVLQFTMFAILADVSPSITIELLPISERDSESGVFSKLLIEDVGALRDEAKTSFNGSIPSELIEGNIEDWSGEFILVF